MNQQGQKVETLIPAVPAAPPRKKSRETVNTGSVPTLKYALRRGGGMELWHCAENLAGRGQGDAVGNMADSRFAERANELLNVVRVHTTRPNDSEFRKLTVVSQTSATGLRLIAEVLGPGLTAGLLERAGFEVDFARSLASEASGDREWMARMAQAEASHVWSGKPYVASGLPEGTRDVYFYAQGANEGRQIRMMLGLGDTTIVYPALMFGGLWGLSIAFEEGLPSGVAGTMRRPKTVGWKWDGEIVISPQTCDPARALCLLLAAWLLSKGGEDRVGRSFTLKEADLEASLSTVTPLEDDGSPAGVMAVIQAAADWMILPLERTILEWRNVQKTGFNDAEEPATLIAMQNFLPYGLVARNTRRLLRLAQWGLL